MKHAVGRRIEGQCEILRSRTMFLFRHIIRLNPDIDPDRTMIAWTSLSFTVHDPTRFDHSSIPHSSSSNYKVDAITTRTPLPPSRKIRIPSIITMHLAPHIDAVQTITLVFASITKQSRVKVRAVDIVLSRKSPKLRIPVSRIRRDIHVSCHQNIPPLFFQLSAFLHQKAMNLPLAVMPRSSHGTGFRISVSIFGPVNGVYVKNSQSGSVGRQLHDRDATFLVPVYGSDFGFVVVAEIGAEDCAYTVDFAASAGAAGVEGVGG
jgi:hypothetical protein